MAKNREFLEIVATIAGPVHAPDGLPMFDGLLAWAKALRDGLPYAFTAADTQDIDLPLQRSPCGRLWLCSQGSAEVEAAELRYTNRRPAIEQFQTLAESKMKRVDIGAGANKGYRIPRPVSYLVDDRITWWAIGAAGEARALLELVTHIGKKRSVGWGRVVEWRVDPVPPWEGFPVLRDGLPLRPLPLDWPGLAAEPSTAFRNLVPPYWRHETEELCAAPA